MKKLSGGRLSARVFVSVLGAALALSACDIPGSINPFKEAPVTTGPVDNSPPPEQASLDVQVLQDIPTFDRCDFLNREYCMFPFPNDYFTVEDASTDTGRRIVTCLIEERFLEKMQGYHWILRSWVPIHVALTTLCFPWLIVHIITVFML